MPSWSERERGEKERGKNNEREDQNAEAGRAPTATSGQKVQAWESAEGQGCPSRPRQQGMAPQVLRSSVICIAGF